MRVDPIMLRSAAAVRNVSSMPEVPTAAGSKVVAIKIDAGVTEDAIKVCLSLLSAI